MSAHSALQNMPAFRWSQRDSINEERHETRNGNVRPGAVFGFHLKLLPMKVIFGITRRLDFSLQIRAGKTQLEIREALYGEFMAKFVTEKLTCRVSVC